jgi:hypothetical protein
MPKKILNSDLVKKYLEHIKNEKKSIRTNNKDL